MASKRQIKGPELDACSLVIKAGLQSTASMEPNLLYSLGKFNPGLPPAERTFYVFFSMLSSVKKVFQSSGYIEAPAGCLGRDVKF